MDQQNNTDAKPIPGFENYYKVTRDGRVWSIRSNKWLKPGIARQGYRIFHLSVDGVLTQNKAAAFVLLTFVGPRPEGEFVRHLNDISDDDRLENLAYGTRQDNADDAIRNGVYARRRPPPKRGRMPQLSGSNSGASKLVESQVEHIYLRYHRKDATAKALAEEYSVCEGNIYAICTKRVSWRWLTETLDDRLV